MKETVIEYRPKLCRGRWKQYSCGNCGRGGLEVGYEYCPGCGRKIFWDSCLTKDAGEYENQQREYTRRKIETNEEYIRIMGTSELADLLGKIAQEKPIRNWYQWLIAERGK